MEPLSYRAFTVSEVVSPSANRNGTLSPMAMPSSAALSASMATPPPCTAAIEPLETFRS